MSVSIKKLINDRQKAFHSGNILQCRTLKYKVQTEIALRKKEYYRNKVQHLKKDDCRKWWQVVNRMSGQSHKGTKFTFEKDGVLLWDLELANSLNTFYISVNADIPLLDITKLPAYLPAADQVPAIEPYTAKNYELLKTGLNNVVLPTLFNVVNNIVQHCYT